MRDEDYLGRALAFLRGGSIDAHLAEVRSRNYHYFYSFSLLGLFTAAVTVILSQLMRDAAGFKLEFFLLFVYFSFMFVSTFYYRGHRDHIIRDMYFWFTPLMALGILMGTYLDPGQLSLTIMVLLCVLPLFIMDKPWRILTYMAAVAAAYSVCCFQVKTRALFSQDMLDLVLFTLMGAGVNCVIQYDRLRNVEYAFSMRRASELDGLTGLYNRSAGERNVKSLLDRRQYGMFCMIDIDGFKSINDEYGHMSGDEVLRGVSLQLTASFRAGDVIARLGGDEFAVFAVGVRDAGTGALCIERLFRHIRGMTVTGVGDSRVSISLGATFFEPGDGKTFENLYRESDDALYQAKRGGKAQYFFFEIPRPQPGEE